MHFFSKKTISENTPLVNSESAFFNFRVSTSDGVGLTNIDIKESSIKCEVYKDIEEWMQETSMSSTNNFRNSHFEAIVEKGEDAVPYILSELEKQPTHLYHALEIIYKDRIPYKGFVSLKQARRLWLRTLKQPKENSDRGFPSLMRRFSK